MVALKEYRIGDIIAVLVGNKKERAVSCRVLDRGMAITKNEFIIYFDDEDVIWRLGYKKRWPNFVHRKFRGEKDE